MADVRITFSSESLSRISASLGQHPGRIKRVTGRATQSAVRAGRTILARGIRDATTLKLKYINRRIKVGTGRITLYGRRVGLFRFKWRKTGNGVYVTVYAGGTPRLVPGGFGATGLSGNELIFVRKGAKRIVRRANYRPNIGRLKQPLSSLSGPTMHDIYAGNPKLQRAVEDRIRDVLTKEITRLIAVENAKL